MSIKIKENIQIIGNFPSAYEKILNKEALEFLARLHNNFNSQRQQLLKERIERQTRLDKGETPDFLPSTAEIRHDANWQAAPPPDDLQKRHVEITGPTDRKMIINALNSGADIFMADFEDSNSPTWENMVEGQINLTEAIRKTLNFTSSEGKQYLLKEKTAVLMVRPRGWHLVEKHLLINGEPISGSLFDFGLYFFHNAQKLLEMGTGPYFYLPKLENHLEARLWNDVFLFAQQEMKIPRGRIRATVLIETILAAFEMEEILYELREHAAGLNAGRWDYIFSIIKKFKNRNDFIFPDRSQITMTVPFMRAYTDLLVKTCHKRGTHAMGGMAAFIPSRKDKEINETAIKKVREDKIRESKDGFDGTWVAHPDLVPIAVEIFGEFLAGKPHQKHRKREDVEHSAKELLNFNIHGGTVTEKGIRQNISVAIQYLESWLRGLGAVAIFNLMEDAATAEISRAQLWQWIHHFKDVEKKIHELTIESFRKIAQEELGKIKLTVGKEAFASGKFEKANQLLDSLVTEKQFAEFLTIFAYDLL